MFDPYYTTKSDGSGIGLAAAFSIVNRHDGLLTIESEPGRGSTLHMYLPATHRTPVARQSRREQMETGNARVLVMDDDPTVREVVGSMLRRSGHATVLVSDGREAVACYCESLGNGTRFDLVILDLTVPGGMGGREALAEIRAADSEVCAIAISGYSNDPVLADPKAYGFSARAAKPFSPADLSRVVAGALRTGRGPSGEVPVA